MKHTPVLALAAVALFAAASVHATVDRTVEKTFNVTAAGTLRVETSGGGITVLPGAGGVVKVTAHEKIRADSDREADELLTHLDLKFEQSGNDVHASAKYDGLRPAFHFGAWPPVQVSFEVTVPAAFVSEVRTSGGSIVIGDLGGAVRARTSGGSIKLGKLGGTVDAHTSGGSISLEQSAGKANLDTSGGSISVGRVAGPAELSTSGGSIRIDAVEQSVNAHSSGGSIRAGIVGPLRGDCSLSTSGGSVRVAVDRQAAFRLDASTSGGRVNASGLTIALETSGGTSRSKLVGAVNGGGPLLKLHTSGGNIDVDTR